MTVSVDANLFVTVGPALITMVTFMSVDAVACAQHGASKAAGAGRPKDA